MKSKDEIRREYVALGYMVHMLTGTPEYDKVKARMDALLWVLNGEYFNPDNYED